MGQLHGQVVRSWELHRAVHAWVSGELETALQSYGLKLAWYYVLEALIRGKDSLHSMHEVAEKIGYSKSGCTRLIDGMVKADLVTREDNPYDRRSTHITPTPRGVATFEEAEPAYKQTFADCYGDAVGPFQAMALCSTYNSILNPGVNAGVVLSIVK